DRGGNGQAARTDARVAVRAELPRRHSVTMAELLAKVILRIEPAAARDLRHAQISRLEQPGRFLQALFLEEMTEEPPREPMETAGDVLARISELARDRFHCNLFVFAKAAPDCFDQRTKQAIHCAPPCR